MRRAFACILVLSALALPVACKRSDTPEGSESPDAGGGGGEQGGDKFGPGNDPWAGQGGADGSGTGLPAPQEVCEHVLRLFEAELGSAIASDERAEMNSGCVSGLVEDHARYGDGFYRTMSGCVLAAQDMAQLERCAPEEPGAVGGDASEPGEPATLPADVDIPPELAPALLCRHLVELMRGADSAMAEMLEGEQGEAFVEDCTADVIQQIRMRGPEGYINEARCAMAVDSFEQLEDCEPE